MKSFDMSSDGVCDDDYLVETGGSWCCCLCLRCCCLEGQVWVMERLMSEVERWKKVGSKLERERDFIVGSAEAAAAAAGILARTCEAGLDDEEALCDANACAEGFFHSDRTAVTHTALPDWFPFRGGGERWATTTIPVPYLTGSH